MTTSQNTVLISGGSAGIGFEIARILAVNNNRVIITGRNKERLESAASRLPGVIPIVCDVNEPAQVDRLVGIINDGFPNLNIVINNAGRALLYDISAKGANAFEKAEEEMLTNYLSIVRLNEKLLPILKAQKEAAIVNTSSIVAFLPGSLTGYSASKAALHSYTQSLRMILEDTTSIKVFELMPPLVNTEFSKEIGGIHGISPREVAEEFFTALQTDQYEIRIGQTEQLYRLYLSSPTEALKHMKSLRKRLLSEKE